MSLYLVGLLLIILREIHEVCCHINKKSTQYHGRQTLLCQTTGSLRVYDVYLWFHLSPPSTSSPPETPPPNLSSPPTIVSYSPKPQNHFSSSHLQPSPPVRASHIIPVFSSSPPQLAVSSLESPVHGFSNSLPLA